MLRNIFASLVTPLSPGLRALGYLDEALAMRRRARKNRDSWQPHLDATRGFVLSAANRCGNRQKVAILGSGLLLDIPLPELADLFGEVLLSDVVCLPETRREINKHPNVRFIEHDVTGLAEQLFRQSMGAMTALPEPAAAGPAPYADADLVVSLNILSQLWVVPRSFIGRHFPGIPPEVVDEWCAGIIAAHYGTLRSLAGQVCLVSDREYVKRDRDRAVISRASTVYDLALPAPDASWTWNIAPLGKENPHTSKELIVGAWHVQ